MIGRRSTIGLALLCAFAFCAFAAQSAMAQVGEKAVNTEFVTCVKDGGERDFTDPHCDNQVDPDAGEYGHEEIPDEVTKLEITNVGNSNLKGVLAGVNTEVECKKTASTENSFLENVLTEGKHTVKGTAQVNFTECEVKKPAKCVIKEPIKTTATFGGVEGLNGKNEMGLEFVGVGEKKEFAELFFQNKGEEKCSLTNGGKPFVVLGSAIGTGEPEPTEATEHTGATLFYEPGNGMETLKIGEKTAEFTGTFTTRMAGGGNPISMTTVT